jgi:5-methylcytosine-specific restriction protein A
MAGRTGPSNPNWRGGSSPERQKLYASSEWRAVRRRVLARDGYLCTNCGQDCKGDRTRHLHHLKPWAEYPELRFDVDNIVTLCRGCHHDEHRKEVSHQ